MRSRRPCLFVPSRTGREARALAILLAFAIPTNIAALPPLALRGEVRKAVRVGRRSSFHVRIAYPGNTLRGEEKSALRPHSAWLTRLPPKWVLAVTFPMKKWRISGQEDLPLDVQGFLAEIERE